VFIQQIKAVKTNGKQLLLVTNYRTFSLTAPKVQQSVEWAEAIEQRLKDSETVRKVVKKAEKLIQKSAEIEKHSKELCEYIEILELENKKLTEDNERISVQIGQMKGRKG